MPVVTGQRRDVRACVYVRMHVHIAHAFDACTGVRVFFFLLPFAAWCRITCLECYFHFAVRATLRESGDRSKVQRILQSCVMNPRVRQNYCSPRKSRDSSLEETRRCDAFPCVAHRSRKMWSLKYRGFYCMSMIRVRTMNLNLNASCAWKELRDDIKSIASVSIFSFAGSLNHDYRNPDKNHLDNVLIIMIKSL